MYKMFFFTKKRRCDKMKLSKNVCFRQFEIGGFNQEKNVCDDIRRCNGNCHACGVSPDRFGG